MTRIYPAWAALVAALITGPVFVQAPSASTLAFVTTQPAGEWLASHFIGATVTNATGEAVGHVNDLLFDKGGQIKTVVLGVGGFLGVGEKSVAVPYNTLAITAGPQGQRVLQVALSREELSRAPEFQPTEKTTWMKAKEKAEELTDQAKKKIDEMRRNESKK